MMVTEQNNFHHIYNVGVHSLKAAEMAGRNYKTLLQPEDCIGEEVTASFRVPYGPKETAVLRWTMLLHDVEKPSCKTVTSEGDHFYGHPEKGADTARNILKRLKFDNETVDLVTRLIRWHDYRFTLTPQGMRRAVNKIGIDIMELLFEVKAADIMAKNPVIHEEKLKKLARAVELFQEIKEKQECVNLKMLNINGKDLIAIGIKPGKAMGDILDKLLLQVLDNPSLNEKQTLLKMAIDFIE